MTYKCICPEPNTANWSVIRLSGRDSIVRCSVCGQIWHTTASYAAQLPERQVSQFEWRQLIKSADYHKGEDEIEGEPGGYLDPDFASIFEEESHET